jgi:hypothetical protein
MGLNVAISARLLGGENEENADTRFHTESIRVAAPLRLVQLDHETADSHALLR